MTTEKIDRYAVVYDKSNDKFIVVDRFDSELQKLGPDDEIPEDHAGVLNVPLFAFAAIVKRADIDGILPNIVDLAMPSHSEVAELRGQILQLQNENEALQSSKQPVVQAAPQLSEKGALKKHAIDKITSMIMADDLARITE